jgi:CRP-like cAMP-binding protein
MKRRRQASSELGDFGSGKSLGGQVSNYRDNEKIYSQGARAPTLFYIQGGGVRLSIQSEHRGVAVTAILGVHEFFGEQCLVGYPLRLSTAVTLTASSIRTIKKEKMLEFLRTRKKASNFLLSYLLSSVKNHRDQVADLLTFSAEQRLASVLLRLSHLDGKGPATREIPILTHQVLSEMVGTTRSRINVLMNRFRREGYIKYEGGLEVHSSLKKILRKR